MALNQKGQIRRQLIGQADLGENFRDVQGALDAVPRTLNRTVELLYTEPMTLGNLTVSPIAIEAVRVLDLSAQEKPVACGSLCGFVWNPGQGGAKITSVDGMSPVLHGGKKYRFTFRLTFE